MLMAGGHAFSNAERGFGLLEDALPAAIADTTTMPDAGSKRIPTMTLSGCGFSHAQSQFTHAPLSAVITRVWLVPHPAISCSCEARRGWGLRCATDSKQFSPQRRWNAPSW